MAKERPMLKNEAIKIDGEYIEDLIPGYTTLKTYGRESLPLTIETYTSGIGNGDKVKYSKYPARTIEVEYLLVAKDAIELLEKINHLNNILSSEESDFVFNDEPDKFFVGVPHTQDTPDKVRNVVSGRWQIYCSDPFKYSCEPIVKTPTTVSGNTAQFAFNYDGTYPARPVLRAEFAGALSGGDYSDDGDCGYIAFIDDDENIIQLGNPDALDIDAYAKADQLINRCFTTTEDWSTSGGRAWEDKAISGSISANQAITDTYWASGAGQTLAFSKPTYGSGTSKHGPILYKATAGAINFNLKVVHRLCVSAPGELGSFECGAYNISGSTWKMLAGFVIEKTGSGTNGTVKYIVNGEQVGSASIDLSYYNTNFGYCNRTAVYKTQYYNKKKKKWQNKKIKKAKTRKVVSSYTYTQSNLNSSISKAGSVVTFKVGNLAQASFTCADIELTAAHNISFHFGQVGSSDALNTNAVNSVIFTRNPSSAFADIPNVFTSGDVVEADCNDASVYLKHANTEDGLLAPQYGALGNNWEDFVLSKGPNVITAIWSDWVDEDYAPDVKIIYNEVYI